VYDGAVTRADVPEWESDWMIAARWIPPAVYRTESRKHAEHIFGAASPIERKNGMTIASTSAS